jgi:hypothetical protein
MSELVVEPFTNEFGQVINPGDEVIFAGTSWKQTSIRKGIFGGVRYDDVRRLRDVKDADGNIVMETNKWGGTHAKREVYTTRAVVAVRVEQVNRGHKYAYVTNPDTGKEVYTKTDEIVYGVSTLPLKRVYKMDTSMSALAGKSF